MAFHLVTSVEDPLPVDAGTLFQIGSTGKTYIATAILILVEQGRIDLHAPVRTYVPELRLKDEQVARDVTFLHLLNHTAGWDGDLFEETGEGDDALDRYVRRMATIEQVTPLGTRVSYNNASFGVAGLVLERVTGQPYEDVIRELLLEPLDMRRTFLFAKEVMTYRFSAGRNGSVTRHPGPHTRECRSVVMQMLCRAAVSVELLSRGLRRPPGARTICHLAVSGSIGP